MVEGQHRYFARVAQQLRLHHVTQLVDLRQKMLDIAASLNKPGRGNRMGADILGDDLRTVVVEEFEDGKE